MASLLLRFSPPPPVVLAYPSSPAGKTILPHSLRLPSPSRFPSANCRFASKHQTPHRLIVSASSNQPTPVTDRLLSSAAYFFPFFNGLQYGSFLFAQYPHILGPAVEPILPILALYRSIPYASYVAFLALYMGVVRNPSLSRYVRFNAMQAVVLDVLLVIPLLILRIFNPGRSGIGLKLMATGYNTLFAFVVSCFVYTLVCSILGRTPYLPFVADAAGRQF